MCVSFPSTQRPSVTGAASFAALPGQADLELVVGIEVEAVGRLDVARIDAAQILEAQAVLDLDRLGQRPGAIARSAIRPAADRYFSISTGETVRTSPMLSKPSPESSVGKFRSARKSTASRSRIVFVYSARFKRLAVTRPDPASWRRRRASNSFSSSFTSVAICSSDGGSPHRRRHLLRLELREDRLPPIAIGVRATPRNDRGSRRSRRRDRSGCGTRCRCRRTATSRR